MHALVIGASGLVGSNIVKQLSDEGFTVTGTYHTASTQNATIQLDKTEEGATTAVITDHTPDIVVDTAAFHAVDDCETQRDRAWSVNATGTRNAAVAAKEAGAHFVYLSTDYVFAGDSAEGSYTEDDPVAPVNYYAQCKYAGEQAAKIADVATILRPSVIYGLASDNFVTWALGELQEGTEIDIVDDQVSTPTYAPDIADACVEIATDGLTGLYHSAGPESLSRYEFTRLLADVYGYDPELVNPISTEELGQEAPRPANSSLDSRRLYNVVGSEFRDPESAFRDMATRDDR